MTIQLVMLPFAGASCFSYAALQRLLPREIQTIVWEPPGRGQRVREPLLRTIDAMVDDMLERLGERIRDGFVVYGHSMGALLAVELARRLPDAGLPAPRHLLCSGREAPSAPRRSPDYHLLPREELVAELRGFGGSPDEILANDELMEFMEPILRADFEAVAQYSYRPRPALDIPISVVTGDVEDILPEELTGWQNESNFPVRMLNLPGGHFFIFERPQAMCDIIVRTLQSTL